LSRHSEATAESRGNIPGYNGYNSFKNALKSGRKLKVETVSTFKKMTGTGSDYPSTGLSH